MSLFNRDGRMSHLGRMAQQTLYPTQAFSKFEVIGAGHKIIGCINSIVLQCKRNHAAILSFLLLLSNVVIVVSL